MGRSSRDAKRFSPGSLTEHVLNLLAKDTRDPGFLNVGATDTFTCPIATYGVFVPLIQKRRRQCYKFLFRRNY